jgi:4-hydroxyphenylpyruvate dioxygenase
MSIQLKKLAGLHYYVRDLERIRRFFVERMGFTEIGKSSRELELAGRQKSYVFRAGEVYITCSTPLGSGGRAWRYLSRHPDGVGALAFEVDDIHGTFAQLEQNGATPITEPQLFEDDHGSIATFSITTPLSDTTFRFSETRGYRGLFPGMDPYDIPRGAHNDLGFGGIDHVTSNLRTMKPMLLWLEHVLGLQPFWGVEFHTDVPSAGPSTGSGLRSQVMWDPRSGIKFANNEPLRPAFAKSQINAFCEQNAGDGIQHVALGVTDIMSTVRLLRARGVELMPAPPRYYESLPAHLSALGIHGIAEELSELAELGILVDGTGPDAYLLQIFLKDSAGLFGSPEAGPFFFELIQRKGDMGFGAGNFRALFDSVEQQRVARAG